MEILKSYKTFYVIKNYSRDVNNAVSICPQYISHFRHLFENYITPANFILLEAFAGAKTPF